MKLDNTNKELKEIISNSKMMSYIESIEDTRKSKGKRYKLKDLLLMILYAVLSGNYTSIDIVDYLEIYRDYFNDLLGVDKIPSHDTISRVMRLVKYDEFMEKLDLWLKECYPDLWIKYNGNKILHVDGKAVRAAALKSQGENPIYFLNAMYEGDSIGLNVERIGDKENEIGKIKEYLNNFNLMDTIVTIDAAGCTEPILNYIVENKGHYLVPLKLNQSRLYECVNKYVNDLNNDIDKDGKSQFEKLNSASSKTKNHGRVEYVDGRIISDTSFIYENLGLESFYGTIGKILVVDKKVSTLIDEEWSDTFKRSYFITDIEDITVQQLLHIRATHWNIEMQHYILDEEMGEDKCTIRNKNSLSNEVLLKRFVLKMKEKEELIEKELGIQSKKRTVKSFLRHNFASCEKIERLLFKDVLMSND